MNRRIPFLAFAAVWLGFAAPVFAQFTVEELADRGSLEEFLKSAAITGEQQIRGEEAVTSPWKVRLEFGDVVRDALWKNPEGKIGGYLEGWKYEIAAYLLDKHLGLNMIPPTVEKRRHGDRGSLQLWIPETITLKDKTIRKIKTPSIHIFNWNRATYLQRAFDNLIANEDRHMKQILITKDWRMILIDHSRSFRSSRKFTRELIFTENHKDGPKLMSELPRAFVEKLKNLTFDSIRKTVGDYLNDAEIRAVLVRRDLILEEIDRLIQANGEDKVLY